MTDRGMTAYWCKHLIGCQRKGYEAYLQGTPRPGCPYQAAGYGTGGRNWTQQRTKYWLIGWDQAAAEAAETAGGN